MKALSYVFAAGLSACIFAPMGSARPVERSQTGGILALQGDRAKAQQDAAMQMAAHCGGQGTYTVVREFEHVVGSDTLQSSDTGYNEYTNSVQSQGGTSTRNAVEYRIQYVCGAAVAPAPAPGPVPPTSLPPVPPGN